MQIATAASGVILRCILNAAGYNENFNPAALFVTVNSLLIAAINVLRCYDAYRAPRVLAKKSMYTAVVLQASNLQEHTNSPLHQKKPLPQS